MMKRILCLLAVLTLLCSAALAEPRYPAQKGIATDGAAVLSVKVLEDLRKLDKRLDKEDMPRLYIVTVDFLDGEDVQIYADTLFDRWDLDDDEMLLLISVGEESYALAAGKNVDRLVSAATQEKLLVATFHEPFMAQQYDVAVAQFVPALVQELNKACGENVKTSDLFRDTSSGLIVNWASTMPTSTSTGSGFSLTRADKATGFSPLTVIIIVVLLLLVFGSFRKSRPRKQPPQKPEKQPDKPVYFKPRQKPQQPPQYFKPRNHR